MQGSLATIAHALSVSVTGRTKSVWLARDGVTGAHQNQAGLLAGHFSYADLAVLIPPRKLDSFRLTDQSSESIRWTKDKDFFNSNLRIYPEPVVLA